MCRSRFGEIGSSYIACVGISVVFYWGGWDCSVQEPFIGVLAGCINHNHGGVYVHVHWGMFHSCLGGRVRILFLLALRGKIRPGGGNGSRSPRRRQDRASSGHSEGR